MAVVVKIPTQLRAAAGGAGEAQLDGATVQEVLDGLFERFERAARADLRRRRLAAALRERVPGRRGHPLPGRPRHAGRGRRRADDPARRRRRLSAAGRREALSSVARVPSTPRSLRPRLACPAALSPLCGGRLCPRSLACLARHARCVLASLAQRRSARVVAGGFVFGRSRA